jgi:riboflavin-specific deaminase-like protein
VRRYVPRAVVDREVEAAYADLAGRRAQGRPYVFVNMVASADGAISVAGRTKALSSAADRYVFHYLRSLADVILVGAQTVRAENYGPPKLPEARQAERSARGQAPVPRIAVVTSSLDLDWSSAFFRDSPTRPYVLTTESADPDAVAAAREVAEVVVAGESRVDLAAALATLAEQGVGNVLCEGGPTLNGVLGAADLIDELCLTLVPALAGGDAGAGLLGHAKLPDLLEMETVHLLEGDGDLFLRYRRSSERVDREAPRKGEVLEPAGGPTVDAFHDVMADIDFPMLIVTASDGEERSGCLVGFGAQCSIDPPRFMVWISKKNHTYRVAREADVLTVHFPSAEQRPLAELFGTHTGDEVDKFASCAWSEGPHGEVVLDDVARHVVGRVTETIDSGDHVAFMLEPIAGAVGPWGGQLGFQSVKDLDPGHEA